MHIMSTQVSQLMYPSFHDSVMPRLKDGLLFTSVVFHHAVVLFLLMQGCAGQSAVIGPLQPVKAPVGDDITLPCHLEPAVDAAAITFEWTRPDLNPRFVHVWRSGENLMDLQNPSYKGRTSIFSEKLKSGDISLKLSKVTPSDEGKYRCFLPLLEKDSFVELIVGAVSTSSTVGIEKVGHGLVLQCNSTGWYPEPEVFWLDGEGNLLSAGPTETVRGPDDLYTVSSRVTVEKRHSNSFTCRVQQNSTNQTRETLIHVPDDFFEVQSSSSSTTVILAVTLAVCILVIQIFGFYVWRQKKIREKKQNDKMLTKEEEKLMKNSSSLSQNSSTGPAVVFKVDPRGKYIQLRNTSKEVQQLGGWTLKVQVNDKEPIKHTFEDSFNLEAKQIFTLWCHGYGRNAPLTDLVLKDLKLLSFRDNLQISLVSHPGEIQFNLDLIY